MVSKYENRKTFFKHILSYLHEINYFNYSINLIFISLNFSPNNLSNKKINNTPIISIKEEMSKNLSE
jgi:hypothetical protein